MLLLVACPNLPLKNPLHPQWHLVLLLKMRPRGLLELPLHQPLKWIQITEGNHLTNWQIQWQLYQLSIGLMFFKHVAISPTMKSVLHQMHWYHFILFELLDPLTMIHCICREFMTFLDCKAVPSPPPQAFWNYKEHVLKFKVMRLF